MYHSILELLRRNRVAKAAKQAFPGNEIPLFRANKEAESWREALVAELKKVNRSKYFTDAAIR